MDKIRIPLLHWHDSRDAQCRCLKGRAKDRVIIGRAEVFLSYTLFRGVLLPGEEVCLSCAARALRAATPDKRVQAALARPTHEWAYA
jgi:hypothetical protein